MRHSLESLAAFAQVASEGSFSAAARKLGKSQSTISETIANLEVDLNVTLFDRSQRQPALTEAGHVLLGQALQVLAANDRLNRSASQLADGLEPRLTVVLSDTFQSETFENMLSQIDQRYPALRFECLIAEYEDVVALVQQGRAHVGLMAAQDSYPPDVAHATLTELSEIVLCVGRNHPLAGRARVTGDELDAERELRLSTYELDDKEAAPPRSTWSAPGYLMLLEMASLGFGWAELPRWMIQRFGRDQLVELTVPGWPRHIRVDVVWSTRRPLGPAGAWLLDSLTRG
ncbi:LysR family transcriptional regulator [Achromobacter sp. UMC46]|uniref:LysR family transcriptional regulator n=1 Tax=Achromobacter sp. UMC46 TaxID=1862319 RepID=UPI00160257B2|nr:LysR family transcriptional regulator [Achromobacter sp. UMC46]MBB1595604.1 transcriptional regulator [Achromobacter sp. UMC46]